MSPFEADRAQDSDELPLPVPTGRVRFETGPDGVETAVVEMYVPRRELPIHRTEAGYPRCATCDGGGCLDCTDSAL